LLLFLALFGRLLLADPALLLGPTAALLRLAAAVLGLDLAVALGVGHLLARPGEAILLRLGRPRELFARGGRRLLGPRLLLLGLLRLLLGADDLLGLGEALAPRRRGQPPLAARPDVEDVDGHREKDHPQDDEEDDLSGRDPGGDGGDF